MNKYKIEYLEHEMKRGQSKDNIRSLKGKLKKLETYLCEEQLQASKLTVRHAQNYQAWLLKLKTKKGSPYARNTLCRCVTEASRFYEFLKTKRIVLSNPFRDIKRLRDQKAVPKNMLSSKNMDRLLCELEKWEEEEEQSSSSSSIVGGGHRYKRARTHRYIISIACFYTGYIGDW